MLIHDNETPAQPALIADHRNISTLVRGLSPAVQWHVKVSLKKLNT